MIPSTAVNVGAITPLPEDWECALCVAAHPGDVEHGMASAAAFDPAEFLTWNAVASGERMGVNAAVLLDVFTLIPDHVPSWAASRRRSR